MSNSLERLTWIKFSLKVANNFFDQPIIRRAIIKSLFELSNLTYKTVVSPCGSLRLYEGTKIIKVGYVKGTKLHFVERWEASIPPEELVTNLMETTFTIKIEYLIKRGKSQRKLQSDVYNVRINIQRGSVDFYIKHVEGLLRTSFDEVFNMIKANFIRNLRTLLRRRHRHAHD